MPNKDRFDIAIDKDIAKCDKYIMESIEENWLEVRVPMLKEMLMADYDDELVSRVTDRRSRTNPLFYREEFEEALDEYEWLEQTGMNSYKLHVPDFQTFPWQLGRLRVIQNILEGKIGQYLEVDEEQYIAMYKRPPPVTLAYDKTVPRKQRIYTLKSTGALKTTERNTFGRNGVLRDYPFSNTPPIPLFEDINEYVEENAEKWTEQVAEEAVKEYYK